MLNFSSYRNDDVIRNLNRGRFSPLDVMLTGVTGAGKSSTINALFGRSVAKVGTGVEPETMDVDYYSLNNYFRIWDTPGLGDGVKADERHKRKMTKLLHKTYSLDNRIYGFIDMAIVLVEGANRDMGSTYTLLNEVIVPHISSDRILVVVNQADVAMKGRHWDHGHCCPDETLRDFLQQQAQSIQNRVREATGVWIKTPVCFSARYGYNLKQVYDFIIDNMPCRRRSIY